MQSLVLALCLVICLAVLAATRKDSDPTARCAELKANWRALVGEAQAIRKVSAKRRKADEWGSKMQNFVDSLGANDAWVTSWARDGSWQNYGLNYAGQTIAGDTPRLCPVTTKLLSRVPGVATAGFSKVLAGGRIEKHTDIDAGGSVGLTAVHLCLTGEAWLRVGSRVIRQRPGLLIAFDPEVEHEVWNDTAEDRTILYLNLQS